MSKKKKEQKENLHEARNQEGIPLFFDNHRSWRIHILCAARAGGRAEARRGVVATRLHHSEPFLTSPFRRARAVGGFVARLLAHVFQGAFGGRILEQWNISLAFDTNKNNRMDYKKK